MALLSLLVLIPILAGARLAMAPVFVYRPEPSGPWQPLYAGPEKGATPLFGGPNYKLQPGKYRACFRVRNGPSAAHVPLATLQVAVAVLVPSGLLQFGRDVSTAAGGSYREEEVSFTVPNTSVVGTSAVSTGKVPLWIDGIRVRWDLNQRARWPLAAALTGLAGLVALAVALWQRRRERRFLRELWAAKVCFAAAAGIAVVPLGPLLPPEMTWLLPPALWISLLMLGGGLVLYAVGKLTNGMEPLMTLADVVSDGIFVAVVLWTAPGLSLFSLAALATVPWAIKVALMVFTLARSRQGRMLPAAVLIAGFAYVGLLPWYHNYTLAGDQSSYLVETVSLLRQHSVNTWEAIEGEQFHEFNRAVEKAVLEADTLTLHRVRGYPARDIGVSLFAAPGYLLGRLDGARLGMELAAVLLAGALFLLIRQLGVSQSAGVLAWAATCFSLPLLHFSSLLYPELLGALLTTAGLLLIGRPPTTRDALLTGMCVGLLPLMNARYWAIAVPLGILAVLSLRQARQWRLLAALAGPALLLVAGQMIVNAAVYGVALPNAGYFLLLRGANPDIYNRSTPFTHTFYEGWAGIWLDKRWGVLSTAPVFLLAVAGIAALWQRSRALTARVLALVLPYLVIVTSTHFWNGGRFSLARYLIPVLPLLALPLAAILENRFRILAGILTAVGALTAMASLTSLDGDYDPTRLAAQCLNSFGMAVAPWLPSLAQDTPKPHAAPYLLPVWIAVTLLLAFLGRSSRQLREARILLAMVFIVAGAAVASVIWDAARGTPPGPALKFVTVTPCRIVDTRNANGPFGGPAISGGATRDFVVPNSVCGIPSDAAAYSVNVTVVPHGPLGVLTVFPSGQARPEASTLNSLDGRVKANAAILAAGPGGVISVFAGDTTDVMLDINGYFVPGSGGSRLTFFPLTPCRIADTRSTPGSFGGPYLGGGQSRSFPVRSSSCKAPASAQAYSVNLTAVPHGKLEFITTFPTGGKAPAVSTLNAPTGRMTANAAIVPAGSKGDVSVFASDDTDLLMDINGYFAPSGAGGLSLYTVAPCRLLDTRNPPGSPPFRGAKSINVAGSPCAGNRAARAYVFGATVVPFGPLGYLSLWPQGQAQSLASTLNAPDGAVTSNMAIVPVKNGSIGSFASDATHLILDVTGYFAP